MTKKIFAMFLAVLMVVSMLPTSVFAADHDHYMCPGKDYKHTVENCEWDSDDDIVVEPTCTTMGYTFHTCLGCGEKFAVDPVDTIPHDYQETETGKDATCTTDGYSSAKKCTMCGDVQDKKVIPATGHNWVNVNGVDCEEGGVLHLQCSACNTDKYESLEAGEHTWSDWTLDKEATAEEEGSASRECTVCGKKQVANVYFHEHECVLIRHEKVEAECGKTGQEAYYECLVCNKLYKDAEGKEEIKDLKELKIDALDHRYPDRNCTEYDAVCELCHVRFYFDEAGAHSWGSWETTTEPTCTEKGEKTRTCTICGETETDAIDANGHTKSEGEVTKKATCLEAGVMHYTCTVLGCDCEWDEPIEKLSHNVNGATFTCKEGETLKCILCGLSYTAEELGMEQPAHSWDNEEYTCKVNVRTCTVCGKTETGNQSHDYKEWIVSTEPTCTTTGYKYRECKWCEWKEQESIPALEHLEKTIYVPGTCESNAYTYTICLREGCNLEQKTSVTIDQIEYDLTNFTFLQFNVDGEIYYFAGSLTLTTDVSKAVQVYLEPVANEDYGYYFTNGNGDLYYHVYFYTAEGVKNYINVSSGFFCINVEVSAEPNDYWYSYDAQNNRLTNNGNTFYCKKGVLAFDEIDEVDNCGQLKAYMFDGGVCLLGDVTVGEKDFNNHVSFKKSVIDATCTKAGMITYCCNGCSKTIEIEIEALGHDFISDDAVITVIKDNTCEEAGKLNVKCSRCDANYDEEIPACGHKYAVEITTAPTCKDLGVKTYTCTCKSYQGVSCDASYTESIPVDPEAHNYKIVGTHIADHYDHLYYTVMKCEYCEDTYTLKGIYTTNKDGKIVADENYLDADGEMLIHWEYCHSAHDGEGGTFKAFDSLEDAQAKHDGLLTYEKRVLAGNCQQWAIDAYKCDCGYTVYVYAKTDDNGNAYGEHIWAGATANGYYEEGTSINEKNYYIAPTCQTVGYEYVYGCTREDCDMCKENAGTYTVLDAVDHKFVANDKLKVDCKNPVFEGAEGYEDMYYEYCVYNCGEKHWHKAVELGRVDDAELCTKYNYYIYSCNCGEIHALYYYGNFGHQWVIGEVTNAPSCTETGLRVDNCQFCDETNEVILDKIPHMNADGECIDPSCTANMKDRYCVCCEKEILAHSYIFVDHFKATCLEYGYDYSLCTNCGDEYFKWYMDEKPTGHAVKEGTLVYVAPTYEATGYREYVCANCGLSQRDDLEKLSGLHMVVDSNLYAYGSLISVTVRLDNVNMELSTFDFKVNFNTNAVKLVGVENLNPELVTLNAVNYAGANENGTAMIGGYVKLLDGKLQNVEIDGSLELVTLQFRVVANIAANRISEDEVKFENTVINIDNVDIQKYVGDYSYKNVSVNVDHDVSANLTMVGDLNYDGKLSSVDMSLATAIIYAKEYRVDLDLNRDGKVNVRDLVLLNKLYNESMNLDELMKEIVSEEEAAILGLN